MSEITTYTSTEEITSINAYYVAEDGSVDYEAIATAIQTGDDSAFAIEDLICAYVEGQGDIPDFMMSAEASMGSPDDYPWLWEEEVVGSLQQLGDLYGNNNGVLDEGDLNSIRNFLTWGGVTEDAEAAEIEDDLVTQIEDALESYGVDEESSEETAEGIYNLFNANDLSEIMTLFISMGNPGVALLLYIAYGLAPATQELQETALDVMEDSSEQFEDLIDQLEDLDPEDLSAQYDSQVISQQLSVVSTVLQAMGEFIQNAQDVIDEMIQLASSLSESTSQTTTTVVRNI